jgi:hypothetical protein
MSDDQLKRWIGAQAALAFLLLPGACALPLLALITPAPARYLFLGVWVLVALALVALAVRAVLRLRRAELSQRAALDAAPPPEQ